MREHAAGDVVENCTVSTEGRGLVPFIVGDNWTKEA